MTDTEKPTIKKRVSLECPASFAGLLELLADIPNEVPHEAEIIEVDDFYDCRHDESDGLGMHDKDHYLSVTLEWAA